RFRQRPILEDYLRKSVQTGISVLVVDDNPVLLESLQLMLSRRGVNFEGANNGEMGLDIAKQSQPDIVLLDIMMPGLDGWEVCEQLRQNSDVPIVMLSALDSEESIERAWEVGADDYIVKPPSPLGLVKRIRELLRRDPYSVVNRNDASSP
ncbi:MAG: response regulator, partial [Chloroflexota bacterium]